MRLAGTVRGGLVALLRTAVMTLMLLLVLDVTWGVVSRYVLGEQGQWTEELARVLLIWLSLMGASLGFESGRHLGMDFFVEKLDPDARRLARVCVSACLLYFAIVILIIGGCRLVSAVYAQRQNLISIPISKAWVYAAVPTSGFFVALFSAEQLFFGLGRRDRGAEEGEPR